MKHPIVQWVDALRSGDYEQTSNCLRKGDSYCCLGVANDLYAKSIGVDAWVEGPRVAPPSWDFILHGQIEIACLHPETQKWLGLSENNHDEQTTYMKMNDAEQRDFKEIATAIEANHPELFGNRRMATYDGAIHESS